MDRRNFLGKLGVVALVPALASVTGFSNLPFTNYNGDLGSRLYVNFKNPTIGDTLKVFIPFRGKFRGIRGLVLEDSLISVSGENGILVSDAEVEAESEIIIEVLDISKSTKILEAVIIMERI